MKSVLLLIDGNSLFHRAYHALPPLTDRHGEMANAVFGFSNMLLKALGEIRPRYVACAFDTAAPTFRHIEFEKYKAQRPAPPADLYPQLPKVKKVLDAFGIPYFEKEGYEADDLLATLASKFVNGSSLMVHRNSKKDKIPVNDIRSTINVVILSGDRDVLQLVDGNVKVRMPSSVKASPSVKTSGDKSEGKPGFDGLFDAQAVKEKFGLEPHQMVDYKSLVGDASDNVPGVAGIGPKNAAILFRKYGTLENLFAHINEQSEVLRAKLEAGKDIALAAKRLVELDRDVDLPFTIHHLRFKPDWEKVRAEYEDLGFKSIVAKLPGVGNTPGSSTMSSDESVESGLSPENTPGMGKVEKPKNNDQLKLI